MFALNKLYNRVKLISILAFVSALSSVEIHLWNAFNETMFFYGNTALKNCFIENT